MAIKVTDHNGIVELNLTIANQGLLESARAVLVVCFDRDFSGTINTGDWIDSIQVSPLAPDSTHIVKRTYSEEPGRKRLILELSSDEDNSDNHYETEFPVGNFFTELVTNEFLANPTDQLDCEWLELINVVEYPLDVVDFAVGDPDTQHRFGHDLRLEPGERLIVCEDSSRFTDYYGRPECSLISPPAWNNLSNLGDIIIVCNDLGRISDSVVFDGGWPDNVTWERDESLSDGDFDILFYRCSDPSGTTPFLPTSTRVIPIQNDLALDTNSLSVIVPQAPNMTVTVLVAVVNRGAAKSGAVFLLLYHDGNLDSAGSEKELLAQVSIDPLEPDSSMAFEITVELDPGYHQVIVALPDDEEISNNTSVICFSHGSRTEEIIITEFLADPVDPLECEWIECRNVSGRTIDLSGWSVGDSLRQYSIAPSASVNPGDYFILTQDSLSFISYYGAPCQLIEPGGWSNLNNSGDRIMLIDNFGTVSDSVTFSAGDGGNVSTELNEWLLTSDGLRSWYNCADSAGNTLCNANSVSAEERGAVMLTLRNRVFSPALGEELFYRLETSPIELLTIEVYDLVGRKHYTIADNRALATGDYTYSGESVYHGKLPIGAYILKITTDNFAEKIGFAVAGSK
jgi:hypothetical protein